jgi:hypothetical protein
MDFVKKIKSLQWLLKKFILVIKYTQKTSKKIIARINHEELYDGWKPPMSLKLKLSNFTTPHNKCKTCKSNR